MNFNNLSAWCIRNPIIPLLLFAGLTLAGIVAFMNMEVQNDPDIDFPIVIVQISQPGAAPSEISTQITEKVEGAVRSLDGLDQLTSTVSEGLSVTMVRFELERDVDVAVNEVEAAVSQIRDELPDGILEPRISKQTTAGRPFAYYAALSEDMTLEQLSWFVDDTVTKRLLSVQGMGAVSRDGGVDREIRVVLDPARMQALGVTAAQINSVLRQSNVNAAGGRAEIAGARQSVRVLGNADTAYQLGQQQISLGDGRSIRLSDVADVSDGYGEPTSISKVNNKPVVTFSLARAKGASDVTVYDQAQEAMRDIEQNNPTIRFVELQNEVQYTEDQYHSSINAMIEGAVLAVIVVFLFLRDWRATFVAALAIPLSAIPTFWFIDLLGFTLNAMSLLALGLVAGVLVDDAIVEIENIVRHMRMGKSAYEASIDAADEIGLAVVATTFSIVAVFFPVGLMGGVGGQFFKNFGLTVVASVLMSLAVARCITPMVAAYFMKDRGKAEHAGGKAMDRYMSVLDWTLRKDRAIAYRRRHPRLSGKLQSMFLDHRVWMMGVGALALLLTVWMLAATPAQFFPNTDTDFNRVTIEMVPGTTLEQTERIADQVEAILQEQPETELVLETVQEGAATLYVTLRDDRERTSVEYTSQVGQLFDKIADARVHFATNEGPGGGSGRDISIMLLGSNPDELEQTAAKLAEEMRSIETIQAPRVAADLQRPELIIEPRPDLAASLGVTTAAISQVIRIATLGEIDQNAAKFSLADRQVPIRVILSERSRTDIDNIRNLPVPTQSGASVPLSRVADISFGSGPTTIQRQDQQRAIFIGADMAPGAAKGDAMAAIGALPTMQNLPQGVTTAPFGVDRWQAELMAEFATALISGVLLVFSVLVLLYKRVMSPLVNMASLLLAPFGGMAMLMLLGLPLSLPVFIGFLMLFGIVAKNSILLIDFALEEIARGEPKFESIMEAGRKRAQPIVMTTIAMSAGMIPTAMSLGGDGAWRAPMGAVVIGGLVVSTFLTLLIVPAGFSLADGVERRLGPWLRRRLLTYRTEADLAHEAAKAERKASKAGQGGADGGNRGPARVIDRRRGGTEDGGFNPAE